MIVCYFGIYNKYYARNQVIITGLRKNGVKVIECNSQKPFLLKYFDLIYQYLKKRKQFDLMIVGFPGQIVMLLAKLLCRKKIVFDAFVSLYDTYVFDRKTVKPGSLKAKYYWFLDWFSCKLADKVLLDTNTHIEYFNKTFNINSKKFFRSFIGSDDELFYPRKIPKDTNKFLVYFYGTYIPLQGIEYIIKAAKVLKNNQDILFRITTSDKGYRELKKKVDSLKLKYVVELVSFVPVEKLAQFIAQADVCLGIFGDTDKTKRAIPTKLYDYIAMRKPVITADTPAIREMFKDNQELAFCQVANGQSLAKRVLDLKNNPELREKLANNSYQLHKNKFCPKVIGSELLELLKELNAN